MVIILTDSMDSRWLTFKTGLDKNLTEQYRGSRKIGAYRIANALRNYGVEIEVIDHVQSWSLDQLVTYMSSIPNLEWVGISAKWQVFDSSTTKELGKEHTSGVFTDLREIDEEKLLKYLRSRSCKIVVGGPTAERLTKSGADIVSIGYSDLAILKIHDHITKNHDLKYTTYKDTLIVDCDKDYPTTDMSNLVTTYVDSDFIPEESIFPIEIGRGCIFHCAFCCYKHLGKKPGTYIRPKEDIKNDIMHAYNNYKATKFIFLDDTFNDSIEKMHLIREIREETGINFEFWAYCRLDVLAAQPEMIDLIPKIGWTSMTFGIETFNHASGKAIGKGANPEKLKKFLLDLRNRFPDIGFHINIIIGLPHDTRESSEDTLDWFIENQHIVTPGSLRIRGLNIKDARDNFSVSKISKNPEKYGYEIIPMTEHQKSLPDAAYFLERNQNPMYVNWTTKSMSRDTAYSIAAEMTQKWKDSVKEEQRKKVGNFYDSESINKKIALIKQSYIYNKMTSRGLQFTYF